MESDTASMTTIPKVLPTATTHDVKRAIPLIIAPGVNAGDCVTCERCNRDVVPSRARRCAKRLGLACFLFFLIKGLLWLVVPLLLALYARR